MSTRQITVNDQIVTLVSLPTSPERVSVQFDINDAVGIVTSIFTGQVQAQQWPGADMLSGTMTLPPLTQAQADDWISFLMQCRGMANAFQIGDPLQTAARGSGAGSPIVDNSQNDGNPPGSQFLGTSGWTTSSSGVLRRGDWFQIGFRLYRAVDDVNSDGSGKVLIPIWPSLREQPVGGIWFAALVGAFTDSSGSVIEPIYIGKNNTFVAPGGTTQLQLGVNDDRFADNTGSWSITVNGIPTTIPSMAMPWLQTGGLNSAYPFGIQDGTSPVVIAISAGASVTINYVSGTVNLGSGFGIADTAGEVGSPGDERGTTGDFFPGHYMSLPSVPLLLNSPMGLFRLAANKRSWSADTSRTTRLSFQIQEYR